MRGSIVGDEEFLAWEPFSHTAFRFNESTSNAISAFAEDYRPNGAAGKFGMLLGRPVMAWLFQRFLYNLRRYVSAHPPTPNA
jgi:hypothetical protein